MPEHWNGSIRASTHWELLGSGNLILGVEFVYEGIPRGRIRRIDNHADGSIAICTTQPQTLHECPWASSPHMPDDYCNRECRLRESCAETYRAGAIARQSVPLQVSDVHSGAAIPRAPDFSQSHIPPPPGPAYTEDQNQIFIFGTGHTPLVSSPNIPWNAPSGASDQIRYVTYSEMLGIAARPNKLDAVKKRYPEIDFSKDTDAYKDFQAGKLRGVRCRP
jgi:hypothetical protein